MKNKSFYNSKEWQLLRKMKLQRNPLCEQCLLEGRRTRATDVDHVIGINHGGPALDIRNLRSLCHSCHSIKTNYIEKLGKGRVPLRGCDASGRPLDPLHFWNREKK
jgi:5-methylcytosine-specific restriction protein A